MTSSASRTIPSHSPWKITRIAMPWKRQKVAKPSARREIGIPTVVETIRTTMLSMENSNASSFEKVIFRTQLRRRLPCCISRRRSAHGDRMLRLRPQTIRPTGLLPQKYPNPSKPSSHETTTTKTTTTTTTMPSTNPKTKPKNNNPSTTTIQNAATCPTTKRTKSYFE